ncbi:isoleucine--tRNA ligase [Candidatus Woesearchaeota archaeon CG10_big_fil_rev_8_21_14_0_10_36_11]|nr:MAG: isoleucine--tRNA ligase [Candidatus Woesearchaeota archaeon CG10_big_fil_rev_8_21_14_0_10_36_11]
MKFEQYIHAELEPKILEYWNDHKTVEKLKKKNKSGKPFTFLQGPPYTSGKVHLGTAWNTSLKDMALRYKRSRGFDVWDRNGYDVHGLPTAHKVMAKHKLKTKDDIEKFGLGKFIKECIDFCMTMGDQMTNDFKRMGVTLDYTDSYMALTNEYMEGEWWMVQQAWKKERLYLGEKVMTWCGDCETAVAKHECEYKELSEDSIFLKFKVKGTKNEYLIIWTTTPWTIPFNLAIMVNPELDYVRAQVEDDVWIVGKGLVGPLVQSVAGKKLKVLEEFKGKTLEGIEYVHPWEHDIPAHTELKKEHPNVHTVILSEQYVDFSAGSGLVHCAPGCGPEDQEVGKQYDIPPFNTLNEKGEFSKETGKFAGLVAKKDDTKFIKELEKSGALIATTKVEHEYPTCWRCHNPVIFKTTKQWFFKIEDLKDAMIQENAKVQWTPKTNAFDSWTSNLKDNSITRQRYWGTPVPIWKCTTCENIDVIGSIKELKEKAGKVPDNLHRPWIDSVTWQCSCKGTMKRILDILDVWIDAGTAAWNCFYYPQREDYLQKYFPADLILEATEQVRLWFSMASICSQLGFGKNCYKNVYMHGMLRDIDGEKMSKSIGNIIAPDEMIEKHGADVLRYYLCQTNAGQDIRFSWDEATLRSRYLQILWNVHKFLISMAQENDINPFKLKPRKMCVEEEYITSKLHSTIKQVTALFDAYHLDETIPLLEELFLELSRTYIQLIRDKAALGTDNEKKSVLYTISHVLFEFLKMFNIISPFITEAIYLNFKDEFTLKEESISHYDWPTYDTKYIDKKLEQNIDIVKQIIQAALNAREKAKLGLRWPVQEIVVASTDKNVIQAGTTLKDIIIQQTNTKSVRILNTLPGVKVTIRPDSSKIGPVYGSLSKEIIARVHTEKPAKILHSIENDGTYTFMLGKEKIEITKEMLVFEHDVPPGYTEAVIKNGFVYVNSTRNDELEAEGFSREVMRHIQSSRKKAGFQKTDDIVLHIKCRGAMNEMLAVWKKSIAEKVGAATIEISETDPSGKYPFSGDFKVKDETFSLWFKKK